MRGMDGETIVDAFQRVQNDIEVLSATLNAVAQKAGIGTNELDAIRKQVESERRARENRTAPSRGFIPGKVRNSYVLLLG